MTTSDKPPKRSLTDAEKDEVLRDIVPILRELRVALADYNLRTHEIERLGSVAANHEERLATVESQVLAGVHSSSWADPMIPVTVEESRPDFLSPPPPRPPTTITGIHDPLVSSQLAAAGTPLRDPVISISREADADPARRGAQRSEGRDHRADHMRPQRCPSQRRRRST